jgi:cytochrome oxidase assembly protein ShyY1
VIVVNRGFVPEGRQDAATRAASENSGPIELVGAMRWPQQRAWFAPSDSPGQNLWFVRDQLAIAAAKGWGEVAPFFIELERPQPPGGLPRPGPLEVNLRNEHLQYAITWYGLAVVFAVMFVLWLRGRRSK